MYDNLKEVLNRKNISFKSFGELIGCSEKSVQNKLNGTSDFTLKEYKKTLTVLPEYNPNYLFTE